MKLLLCMIYTASLALFSSGISLNQFGPRPELSNILRPIQLNSFLAPNNLYQDEQEVINIHMVPHTHDDLGWLKTVDEYYYGLRPDIGAENVQMILDNIFPYLEQHPERKFIYVEVGFFKKWWNDQTKDKKDLVLKLIQNGQFEFINGGYCMNDEASVYYEDAIDQMTLGHQFLLESLNIIPQIGWHIDPFGHANAQAALFAQMGFNAFYVARIDHQDKAKRLNEKSMEMIWIPETSQGVENAIFTHVNFHHYSNPSKFCFDILCHDPTIDDYNVESRSQEFVNWFRKMQQHYTTNELFHTAGEDFHYMKPDLNYKNFDTLFEYINTHTEFKVNAFYSTPSQYLKTVYNNHKTYPIKTDDFFPYADHPHAYWTGYFTSRVALKGLVRNLGKFLQASKRLVTQSMWNKSSGYLDKEFKKVDQALATLEEPLAILQHHDGVSGTSRQHVVEDYKKMLDRGENTILQVFHYYFIS